MHKPDRQEKLEALRLAIAKGLAQAERGELIDCDMEQIAREVMQKRMDIKTHLQD